MNKKASAVTVIGGADGPTSVLILGEKQKKTFRQKLWQFRYRIRKYFAEKGIKPESHSIDEVITYLVNECGLTEIDRNILENSEEYSDLRASNVLRFQPDLLGEFTRIEPPKNKEPEIIQEYMKKVDEQRQLALAVPREVFDIDMHKFIRKYDNENYNMDIIVETRFICIEGNAVGKKPIRDMKKIMKKAYKYYGVTQEDIDNKSERYRELVSNLCM